ncbi:MAG: adenylate/guanylate cyclase domain-containing protein [Chloroflexi bacterium]|nr:adenylate/guanylate cyclase domain-containing protein [Chloroflexota bacterium]
MPNLPRGTVTFLFTDIEGSTRLWQAHPEAMQAALARHDALLRATIEAHSGYVFKTVGDEFCAAFDAAPAALAAALAIQRALTAEDWTAGAGLPRPAAIKVRAALHTGAADVRDGDYFGATLSRVARLMAAGHGGQTLLSHTTQVLVQDALPAGVTLLDLGERRLRDLVRPEQIFQLVAPDLPADFPSLRTLDAFPHNLPVQLTSFIGREKEMADIKRLLPSTHLLTLTGVGGTGKTRLSLQAGADLLDAYPDGVWLVEFAPLADPHLVPQAIASVLGVPEAPGQPLEKSLLDYLRAKHLLLILDNCEHLIAACARLAETILRACPQVKILASSREGLGIQGEMTLHVPSLAAPDPAHLPPLAALTQYEAVKLFIDRAVAARAEFSVNDQNAAAVAQICHRLDGIPLAIELAAARVRTMPVELIARRLDDRFRLLTGGSRTALPRQQTLAALIDWSYNLLTGPERMLLRRLSVFAGGWTLEAAEAVCADINVGQDSGHPRDVVLSYEILDLLNHLVDKSLVVIEAQDSAGRYRLLETIRQYARDRLLESGKGDQVRNQHVTYFLQLAEAGDMGLRGPQQMAWMKRLETEHDNLRTGLRWSLASEQGLRLVGALAYFWWVHTDWREGLGWLEEALAQNPAQGRTAARARALWGAGILIQGGYSAASRSRYAESIAIAREVGDQRMLAHAQFWLGYLEFRQNNLAAAGKLFAESQALSRAVGDHWGTAFCAIGEGDLAMEVGDYAAARAIYEQGVAGLQQIGDRAWAAALNARLGRLDREEGDYPSAYRHFSQRLEIGREMHSSLHILQMLLELGHVALRQGAYSTASAHFMEGLALARELGDKGFISWFTGRCGELAWLEGNQRRAAALYAESLELARGREKHFTITHLLRSVAGMAIAQGAAARAVQLCAAAAANKTAYVDQLVAFPINYEQDLATARAQLGDAAFEAAWAAGQAMTLEQAIDSALEEVQDSAPPVAEV